MTLLNLTALEDGLYKHLGLDITNDQADLSLEDADRFINRSALELFNKVKLKLTEVTVEFDCIAGQKTYHLPEDFSSLITIAVKDPGDFAYSRLNRMIHREYVDLYVDDDSAQTKPTHYIREGDIIRFYPTPEQIYTFLLKYHTSPALFSTTNTSITGLPEEYEEVILYGAVYRGFFQLNDYERAIAIRGNVRDLMKSLETVEEEEERDSPLAGLDVAWGPSIDSARKANQLNSAEDIQRNR